MENDVKEYRVNRYFEIKEIEFIEEISLDDAIIDAINLARNDESIVQFNFNKITLRVNSYSKFNEIKNAYDRRKKRL